MSDRPPTWHEVKELAKRFPFDSRIGRLARDWLRLKEEQNPSPVADHAKVEGRDYDKR